MDVLLYANNTVQTANQISNTTTETLFNDQVRLPASNFSTTDEGKVYEVAAHGYISSAGSSPGTLTLKLKYGSTVLGTAVVTLPTGLNNAYWRFDGDVVVCASGSSGKFSCQGLLIIDNAGTLVSAGMVNTGLGTAGQVSVNTTVAAEFGASATFSIASASNAVTCTLTKIKESS